MTIVYGSLKTSIRLITWFGLDTDLPFCGLVNYDSLPAVLIENTMHFFFTIFSHFMEKLRQLPIRLLRMRLNEDDA